MDSQVAAKAVIVNPDNKALIMCERGRWQAPGGRLEPGETLRQGLKREILEETGISNMEIGEAVHVDEWFAKPEGVKKHIVAVFFACKVTDDKVVISNEHEQYAWVAVSDLANYVIEPEIEKAIKKVLIDAK